MRLFQNAGIYPAYLKRLQSLVDGGQSFADQRAGFLADRYGACHILKPVLDDRPEAFFTNGDDETLQRTWARENGVPARAGLAEILLAQIEHHRTEIFYNLDPMRYGDEFLKRIPGCVRTTVAWRAAPSKGGRFLGHDVIVNNFPSILNEYRRAGTRAEYFTPAHDPEMDRYAANRSRPIDILFVGSYSRHHRQRAETLERVAELAGRYNVVFCLEVSRATKLSATPLGLLGPLRRLRMPKSISTVSRPPIFGRALYEILSKSKIVLNGAIDLAGRERGNMRVWEALGCGAALVSDAGQYPSHIESGIAVATYKSPIDATDIIENILENPSALSEFATAGHHAISAHYNKSNQWARFVEIVQCA